MYLVYQNKNYPSRYGFWCPIKSLVCISRSPDTLIRFSPTTIWDYGPVPSNWFETGDRLGHWVFLHTTGEKKVDDELLWD